MRQSAAAGRSGIFRRLDCFEAELAGLLPESDRSRLGQAMRYAMFPGGKRLRPMLCLATYAACGGSDVRPVLPFACGIELLHAFTLIQDDLPCMDNDRMRRGKPALHVAFGEADALLAADALFALAFETFAGSEASPGLVRRAIAEIARSVGVNGVAQGQLLDLAPDKPRNPQLLRRIHLLKTARLISVSMKCGALLARARTRVVAGLERAGTWLGMLFQITDDLLDAARETGPEAPLNYPALHGRAGARLRADGYRRRYRIEIERLRPVLTRSGRQDLQGLVDHILSRKQ